MGWPLWRTVWRLLKKLKIELSHNLAILLLGMYVKKKKKNKTKPVIQNDPHTLVFTTVSFIITKIQKQPRCPLINEWLKKVWYI